MKKILKLTIIASLIVGLFASCEKDFLDVNDDPNNATEATAGQIFPAATASMAGVIGGNYALAGGIWSQYWTQANSANQYKNYSSFNLSPDDLDRFAWEELYSGALNDFKDVKEKSSANSNWSYYLMATVLESYTYQVLVDLYDKIPYSEALQGADNLNPAFDDGDFVYDDLISNVDNALGKNLTASSVTNPGDKDFIFNGDLDQWVRFANTLKLKFYLRQRYANPTIAENGITDMYNQGAEFLAIDAKMDVFVDQDSKSNPFYEMDRRQLNTPNNLRASETMVDSFLAPNSDPRLQELYNESVNGTYTAMPQGSHNAPTSDIDPDDISVVHLEPTDPVKFISAAESHFLQAEVALIYGLGGSAQTHYENGVMAAFAQYGLDGSSFIASGGAYEYPASGTEAEQLEAIITQKWAAMARFQGMEAWTEWRRTGYPDFFTVPVDNALGTDFLLRLLFPDSERKANTNTPAQVPVTVPVWWDQD
ncbi:MAG: SusD/RagB family nutrient-binding outer membrane lipoprotein [Bacteroidales bacterium]|nr:SusD/RagB family nutrient-binding outer membrane lipoprotein [Bacteroidales bacterium]